MLRARWNGCLLLGSLLCLIAAGCGGGADGPTGLVFSGKVLDGGQPVAIEDYGEGYNYIEVLFTPVDASGKPTADAGSFGSEVEEDGSFSAVAPEAGKHLATVYRRSADAEGEGDQDPDLFQGKYGPDKSTFVFDIEEGSDIVIDLAEAGN